MNKEHKYTLDVLWTGNLGTGTTDYRTYDRSHTIIAEGKEDILASSDPAFRGDKNKYNPEEFLLASISSCHMLWFLHLCADAGVIVTEYLDKPTGLMVEHESGGGQFKEVTLNPIITVTESSMLDLIDELHDKAYEKCFISNSMNFPIYHNATCKVKAK